MENILKGKELIRLNVYSDEYLLNRMEEFVIELGRMPSKSEVNNKNSIPSSSCYYSRFGGLNKVAKKLGFRPNRVGKWTKGTIKRIIKSLIKELRRVPTESDLEANKDAPCPISVREHLGTGWQKKEEFLEVLIETLEQDLEDRYFKFDITGYWQRNNRYVTEPIRNKKKHYLGTFKTEKRARKAIVEFRVKKLKEELDNGN